jgi:hypothetical protein
VAVCKSLWEGQRGERAVLGRQAVDQRAGGLDSVCQGLRLGSVELVDGQQPGGPLHRVVLSTLANSCSSSYACRYMNYTA